MYINSVCYKINTSPYISHVMITKVTVQLSTDSATCVANVSSPSHQQREEALDAGGCAVRLCRDQLVRVWSSNCLHHHQCLHCPKLVASH